MRTKVLEWASKALELVEDYEGLDEEVLFRNVYRRLLAVAAHVPGEAALPVAPPILIDPAAWVREYCLIAQSYAGQPEYQTLGSIVELFRQIDAQVPLSARPHVNDAEGEGGGHLVVTSEED